jgi:hypothetical protein
VLANPPLVTRITTARYAGTSGPRRQPAQGELANQNCLSHILTLVVLCIYEWELSSNDGRSRSSRDTR